MRENPLTQETNAAAVQQRDAGALATGWPALRAEQGVSRSEVLRGALTRFLPGGALIGLITAAATGGLDLDVLALLGVVEVPLTLGYFAGLELLRRWLRSDADVVGRKSLIAGAVAPLVLFCVLVLVGGAGLGPIVLWSVASGLGTALALFFPWLRTPGGTDEPEKGPAPLMLDWNV